MIVISNVPGEHFAVLLPIIRRDVCSICSGDGKSCLPGCDNVPFSNKTVDACGVCGGNGDCSSSEEIQSSNKSSSTVIIAAAVGGGGALLVIIIAVLAFLFIRKRASSSSSSYSTSPSNDVPMRDTTYKPMRVNTGTSYASINTASPVVPASIIFFSAFVEYV
jgi:hypothetical protein